MSKKRNNRSGKNSPEEKKTAADYYKLKTDAVDKLVNAKNAPKVSDAEIRKYTSKNKFHIPTWVKILFIKFWFSGAICYFFLWGLGIYLQNLDLMFALSVGLGIATDLMVNHLLHSFEPEPHAFDRWMMVTTRKFWSLFVNVAYAGVVLYCVIKTYEIINTILVGNVQEAETVAIGVEPLLFGLLYMGFDMLLILMKNTLLKIIRDASAKAAGADNKKA